MPAESIDMALDDLVQGGSKKGGGKGKGKKSFKVWGNKSSSDGKGRAKGKGKKSKASASDARREKPEKAKEADGSKMDMTLEEVIGKEGTGGRKGKGGKESKGKGKGKSDRGKGKDDKWSSGKDYDKGYGKGKDDNWSRKGSKGSKGSSKGKSNWGGGYESSKGSSKGKGDSWGYEKLSWNEHDDRDGDDGRRSDAWEDPYAARRQKGSGKAGRNDRESGDGWQRVTEERAPIRDDPHRDSWRDEAPAKRGRSPQRPVRRREAVEPREAPAKRARLGSRQDVEDGQATKSVKVTGIPRDVQMRDIKEAFEAETGKIVSCRLERGTAWIAFTRAADAKKAIATFDRGELNGAIIGVALDR